MRPFTGYQTFEQFIQAHTNDIAKTLQKAISEQSPSICGRVFNGLAWREDMDLSIKLFNAAQGIPALEDLGAMTPTSSKRSKAYTTSPNSTPTLRKSNTVPLTPCLTAGQSRPYFTKTPLKPLLDKIYNTSSMDTNS